MTDLETSVSTGIPAPDEFQQRVIDAPERSIRVVAPAGSGKTETLARRAEERIRQGVPAHRMLVLTFDRNAAESFRAKLRRGGLDVSPRVETLNAYGYALLRQHFPDERSRVITEPFWPGSRYLSDLVNEYGLQVYTSMLSKIKNQVFDPRQVERKELSSWIVKNKEHLLRDLENEEIGSKISPHQFGHDLASEYLAYEKFLHERGGIDFDDQKLRPLIRLRKDRKLLKQIQGTLDEVIVDEFQDINQLDSELIALISPEATLVVTGDDDQAIYGFRGASAEYLISPDAAFKRQFAHYELSINYRCPTRILDAAGKLIVHNETRIEKHPRAAKRLPGTIEALTAKNPDQEAAMVARHAGTLLEDAEGAPRAVAILTRTNNQGLDLQAAMIRAETPYQVPPENDIRITWELARKMLLLCPVIREGDVPPAEIRQEIVGHFAAARRMQGRQIGALIHQAMQDEWMFPGPGVLQLLPERMRSVFTSSLARIRRSTSLGKDIEALEDFLNAIVSRAMDGGRKANEQSRLSGLADMAGNYGEQRTAFDEELDRLISIQRAALRNTSAPKVTLSTCHGAKGREWQVVFVPQCNVGVFPDARSEEGEYLEAERKLFYVSMTRASEHLVTSWSTWRKESSRNQDPSLFLIEAGIAKPPKKKAAAPKTQSAARAKRTPFAESPTSPVASWKAGRPARAKAAPGRPKRMITLISARSRVTIDGVDPARVIDLTDRLLSDEERYDLPLGQMTIRYQDHDTDATLPLQLDLALRGVPFVVPDPLRFTEAEAFKAMLQAWSSRADPVAGSLSADTVAAMEHVLERATGSNDHARWRTALERISDEEPGTDPEGVQFLRV